MTDREAPSAFVRARLDEEEAAAKAAKREGYPVDSGPVNGWFVMPGRNTARPITLAEGRHAARHNPDRVLREVATWRRVLLEYAIPPGTDAVYGGTERETGFRLALSFALKAKAMEYEDHPDYPEDGEWP